MPLLWNQPQQGLESAAPRGGMEQYWPALLTAGLGMLEQSGWTTMPVTTGQALGRGGLLAMGPLMNIRQQIQTDNQNRALSGAIVMKDNGEPDAIATARNLSKIGRNDLALKFIRDQNLYQTQMVKESTQAQEVSRRLEVDKAQRALNDKIFAQQYANKAMFNMIQNGVPEPQAKQQAGLLYVGMLQARGLPQSPYDPTEDFGVGGEGGQAIPINMDMPEDQGGFVPTGGGGELMPVGRKKAADPNAFFGPGGGGGGNLEEPGAPMTAPGLSPVPPEAASGQGKAPEGYNWLYAYQYNKMLDPKKFNPQTADFIIDYKTKKPIPNTPRVTALLERAKAGKSETTINLDKSMPKVVLEQLDKSYSAAESAVDNQNAITQIQQALNDPQVIAGTAAGQRLDIARLVNYMSGGKASADQLASTGRLIQGLSELTLASRGLLKGQGQISDRETELLQQARGGNFNMSVPELKALMGAFTRMNKAVYERHQDVMSRAKRLKGVDEGAVDFFSPRDLPGAGSAPRNVPAPARSAPKKGDTIDFNERP